MHSNEVESSNEAPTLANDDHSNGLTSSATKDDEIAALRPSRDLNGRVAIVTGAGSPGYGVGNGRAAAIMLAEDGANVICVDINRESVDRTVQLTKNEQTRGTAVSFVADVAHERQCESIVKFAMNTFGRLDILVNNVGIHGPKGTAVGVDVDAWTPAMQVNVTSMVMLSKYAIPAMLMNPVSTANQVRGSIVNVASVNGVRGGSPDVFYPTSKGAIVNLTRAMAAHHGRDGIRVNCVCPGAIYTPMVGGFGGGMNDKIRQNRANRNLLGTEGNAWDVGAAIRYLASDLARWITGVILPVDAGAIAAVGVGQNLGH